MYSSTGFIQEDMYRCLSAPLLALLFSCLPLQWKLSKHFASQHRLLPPVCLHHDQRPAVSLPACISVVHRFSLLWLICLTFAFCLSSCICAHANLFLDLQQLSVLLESSDCLPTLTVVLLAVNWIAKLLCHDIQCNKHPETVLCQVLSSSHTVRLKLSSISDVII